MDVKYLLSFLDDSHTHLSLPHLRCIAAEAPPLPSPSSHLFVTRSVPKAALHLLNKCIYRFWGTSADPNLYPISVFILRQNLMS